VVRVRGPGALVRRRRRRTQRMILFWCRLLSCHRRVGPSICEAVGQASAAPQKHTIYNCYMLANSIFTGLAELPRPPPPLYKCIGLEGLPHLPVCMQAELIPAPPVHTPTLKKRSTAPSMHGWHIICICNVMEWICYVMLRGAPTGQSLTQKAISACGPACAEEAVPEERFARSLRQTIDEAGPRKH